MRFIWRVYTNVIMSDLPREKRRNGQLKWVNSVEKRKVHERELSSDHQIWCAIENGKYDLIESFRFKDYSVTWTVAINPMRNVISMRPMILHVVFLVKPKKMDWNWGILTVGFARTVIIISIPLYFRAFLFAFVIKCAQLWLKLHSSAIYSAAIFGHNEPKVELSWAFVQPHPLFAQFIFSRVVTIQYIFISLPFDYEREQCKHINTTQKKMVMTSAYNVVCRKIHKGWIKRESFYLTLAWFGRETRGSQHKK